MKSIQDDPVFRIADCCIRPQIPVNAAEWAPFSCDLASLAELSVRWHFQGQDFYDVEVLTPACREHILKSGEGLLFADRSWTDAELYAQDYEAASPLLVLALCGHLATRGGFLCHSSLVDFEGNGILFLGPSGIGKTTQAELWQKFTGAEILNGDLVFVREKSDGFYGYGSPWHGSSPYFLNRKVPVRAMILLSQAEGNTLTRISGLECLGGVLQQVYLPAWDKTETECCLTTLDRMLGQVPVYHLACRPDEDAVQTVKKELNL